MQRISSPQLDNILGAEFPILDHGFIRVIDYMGNDSSIVQAARVSYGAGTKSVSTDKALINYLMRHEHMTPFEMCVIKFHIKLPIFVARQWQRHRNSYNEISARYSEVQDEFYIPQEEDVKLQSKSNHQGRDEESQLPFEQVDKIRVDLKDTRNHCYRTYKELLDKGVARELARTTLPVSQYTEFYWTLNLRSLFNFIRLRIDSHAQFEIRVYAQRLAEITKLWVPDSYEAFSEYMLNSYTLSAKAHKVVNEYLKTGQLPSPDTCGLSKREYSDLLNSSIFEGVE